MKTKLLQQIVNDSDPEADIVTLSASPNGITAHASSYRKQFDLQVDKDSDLILLSDVKKDSRASFSLDFLRKIVPFLTSEQITLELSTNAPLRISYTGFRNMLS